MSSNSTAALLCAPGDHLCIVKEHEQAVIIVPTLLLLATVVTLLALCLLRYCPERKQTGTTAPKPFRSSSRRHRHHLQGIDAPPGLNPLEHEELPMSVQQVQQSVRPTLAAVPQMSTDRHHGAFSQVTALPLSFFVRPNDTVSVYRARMDKSDVTLRVLKESANGSVRQHFLGFASFVSALGPHPFLPALLGVVSVQSPLMMVVEELQHRDLLGFLHSQRCIHGNVAARSVLVGGDLTAKLWGLGPAYRRSTHAGPPGEVEDTVMKKWQAPEVLGRGAVSQSSDVWSFGILLYEMVTLGDPPFAQVMATELLQYLQRGKHLKRPATCSNSLYSIIKSCCHWIPHQRLSMSALIGKLLAGEKSANGRTVLRVPEPLVMEKYLREAGYAEAYNYSVL